MDLALNNLQRLICYKTQQQTNKQTKSNVRTHTSVYPRAQRDMNAFTHLIYTLIISSVNIIISIYVNGLKCGNTHKQT